MRGVDRMQMQRKLQPEIAGITRPLLRIHTDLSGKRTELLIQLYPFSPVSEHSVPAFLFAANFIALRQDPSGIRTRTRTIPVPRYVRITGRQAGAEKRADF